MIHRRPTPDLAASAPRQVAREFQVFVKPTGALCNLDCRYCYYLEKLDLHPTAGPPRMADDLLEEYIVQHLEASPVRTVSFSWHGGEPTVLGVDYFRRIVSLQQKHVRPGWRITNGVQTNGVLIDEEWCRFFAAECFSVGLSVDGPADVHDCYRVTKGQKPSHAAAVRAFRMLRRFRVPCDLLCVVHDRNVREPLRTYRFFKDLGARYVSFLPLVVRGDGEVLPESVPARAYGEFLCTVFDEWVRRDIGRIDIQNFEEAFRPARGMDHSLCVFRETCGDIPVVEHNGDFYCCDHYVDAAHRLGNIRGTPLRELLEHPAQRNFGNAKLEALPRQCRVCEVRAMCHGGCPKDRFIRTADGEDGLNYLCAGFLRFFRHVLPHAIRLAELERLGRPREDLMPELAAAGQGKASGATRNDPCPCGSGRKYKKCCGA
ncbi:MAG: anaerobic sulfatase maturase [Acidobacteriota bacterium]